MKRIGLLKTLAVVTAIIGSGLALNQTTAQAKGFTWLKTKDYSANPPLYSANTPGQSVTMWNWNHTKKLHNLRNYPHTQWSVVQSVKMYNPKKTRGNKTGIYYKLVKGNKYGYVHRNFVNRVTTSSGTGTVTPTPKPSNDLNNLPKVDPKLIDEKLNQELISLFPGAVPDTKLQKLAEQIPNDQVSGPISNQSSTFKTLLDSTLNQYIMAGFMNRSQVDPSIDFKSFVHQSIGYIAARNMAVDINKKKYWTLTIPVTALEYLPTQKK